MTNWHALFHARIKLDTIDTADTKASARSSVSSVNCVTPYREERPVDDKAAEQRDLYNERAAIRQYDGHYTRAESERLAWGEVLNEWRRRHGKQIPPSRCAGCGEALSDAEAFDLGDGSRAHRDPEWRCVIAYGKRWHRTAEKGLAALGLYPPPKAAP